MLTAQDLVRREVHYCVSTLVSTLAQTAGGIEHCPADINELCAQAYDLAAPVEDYEEAAREAGWRTTEDDPALVGVAKFPWRHATEPGSFDFQKTAQDVCEEFDIEPHYREVYEHWIVSDWLADKLIEKGEKVDKDFAGLTIWARTTTGQAVYADHVIEQITTEVNKA